MNLMHQASGLKRKLTEAKETVEKIDEELAVLKKANKH